MVQKIRQTIPLLLGSAQAFVVNSLYPIGLIITLITLTITMDPIGQFGWIAQQEFNIFFWVFHKKYNYRTIQPELKAQLK